MPLPSSVLHLNLDVTKCILPDVIDGSTLIQDGCPSPSWPILLNRIIHMHNKINSITSTLSSFNVFVPCACT